VVVLGEVVRVVEGGVNSKGINLGVESRVANSNEYSLLFQCILSLIFPLVISNEKFPLKIKLHNIEVVSPAPFGLLAMKKPVLVNVLLYIATK